MVVMCGRHEVGVMLVEGLGLKSLRNSGWRGVDLDLCIEFQTSNDLLRGVVARTITHFSPDKIGDQTPSRTSTRPRTSSSSSLAKLTELLGLGDSDRSMVICPEVGWNVNSTEIDFILLENNLQDIFHFPEVTPQILNR
jgi:hypothetical protein